MKRTSIAVVCALFSWTATNALAQTGLYGSPEPISLTQSPVYPAQGRLGGNVVQTSAAMPGNDPVALTPNPASPSATPMAALLNEPTPAAPQGSPSDLRQTSAPAPADSNGAAAAPNGGYITNQLACGGGCDGSAGCNGCGGCGDWTVNIRALVMTRDKPNTVYTSAESNNQDIQGSYTSVNSMWGGEVDLERDFCCGEWGIEGVFWTPGLMQSSGGPGIPGPYLSPLVTSTVNLLGPTGNVIGTGNQWTDNFSPNHMVWRTDECYDFELNYWKNHLGGGTNTFWQLDGMLGFRYFTFRDRFLFGAERNPNDGSPYAGDWFYMNDDIKNNFAAFQFGFNLDWRFADRWRLFFTPKFAVGDNHMQLNYDVYAISTATGYKYQGSSQNYTNPNYPVNASVDGFSFLAQIDIGLEWKFSDHVGVQIGYRFVGMTGVGLSDNQIPIYATDTQAISKINSNGDLTLNGAFAGLTFTF